MMINRRDPLKIFAGVGVGWLAGGPSLSAQAAETAPFVLPPLPYTEKALEPYIDSVTMGIHHDKHHAAYVANANAIAQKWPDIAARPMEAVLADLSQAPEAVRAGVRNNLGGHWNHSFFWTIMTPKTGGAPQGDLKAAIEAAFGSAQNMIDQINAAGTTRFGSGWAWLVLDKNKKLAVVSTANQDTPLELGARPILGVDVWEHAYYLKYQNRRADYLKAWWSVVDWDKASENFAKAM